MARPFALASETDGVAIYTDPRTPPRIARLEYDTQPRIGALAWDEEGGKLLVKVNDIGLWSLDPLTGLSAPVNTGLAASAMAAAPAGGLLALGCDGGLLCLYGTDGLRRGAITAHTDPIASLRWSPDGRSLLSIAPNDPVRLWSLGEDRQVSFGLPNPNWTALTALAVDRARGLVAAGDELGYIHVWDRDNAEASYTALNGRVTSLAFLSDGGWRRFMRTMASAFSPWASPSPTRSC